MVVGGVKIRLGATGRGIAGWTLTGAGKVSDLDGLATEVDAGPADGPSHEGGASPGGRAPLPHDNGVTGIDHLVAVTPDFDRTVSALEQAGLPLKRVRRVGQGPDDPGAFRQGFRRMGEVILELVEARGAPEGPARFWGLTFTVNDLEGLGELLGEGLGRIRPAVQPGRRIATLRRSVGLSTQVAFITPEQRPQVR